MKSINHYFWFCFLLNVISIILVDGFKIYEQDIFFLGIDNRWIFTYLPWMLFELMLAEKKQKYDEAIIAFMLTEISLIYKWSVSALLLSFIWIIPIVIKNKIYLSKYAIPTLVATIGINIAVVFLKVQNYFLNIMNFLHKDVTLSGRTLMWDKILKSNADKSFLGNGMQSLEYDKNFFGSSANNELDCLKVGHAHNSYMTVLYRYGVLGLFLYLINFILPIIKLKENSKNRYSNILLTSVVIVLLLSLFDTIDCSGFYFTLGLAFSIKYIERGND